VLALVVALLITSGITWVRQRPAAASAPSGGPPLAYVISGTNVAVLNAFTNTTVTVITTLHGIPTAIAVTPDAQFVLVTLVPFRGTALFDRAPVQLTITSPELALIRTSTNQVVGGVTASVGFQPRAIAITPDGSKAFVVDTLPTGGTGTILPVAIGTGPSLTAGARISPGQSAVDVAVSPDGQRLYVLDITGLLSLKVSDGTQAAPPVPVPGGPPRALVVSPDGADAYVAVGRFVGTPLPGVPPPPFGGAGYVDQIVLGTTPHEGTKTPLPAQLLSTLPSIPDPVALAIATTPVGSSTLYAADTNNQQLDPIPLPATGAPTPAIGVGGTFPSALAATPDGARVEVTAFDDATSRSWALTLDTAKKALTGCAAAAVSSCPLGDGPLAITPDQRPVASFAVTPAGPGQPTGFDASASTIAYGTIANYHWDFGDGATQDTTGPTTTHTYATAGAYSISLTETDWAGTSVSTSPPSTIFTGHTMTRRGGPEAKTTRRVTIPNTPTSVSPSPVTPTPTPTASPGSPTPKISLLPKVGPPGTVVAVSGSGFPANAPVTLGWKPGIGTAGVTTSPAGTFTNRLVLILPKDQLGDRLMVAQTFGATATFLVVPPSISPGGHGADLVLLFRR